MAGRHTRQRRGLAGTVQGPIQGFPQAAVLDLFAKGLLKASREDYFLSTVDKPSTLRIRGLMWNPFDFTTDPDLSQKPES